MESLIDKLYEVTNDGLDIILSYYPQAYGCDVKGKFFKIRGDEKTPSAAMKKINGVWRVTDFGDEATAMNPIEICMREERLDFKQALHRLADRYGVSNRIDAAINKAKFEQFDAKPDQKEGDLWYDLKEEFSDFDLEVFGPMTSRESLQKYQYFSVESYCTVKNRKVTKISSTDTYPIFLRKCGSFVKIYQPLNAKKQYRFFYHGDKPKDFLNGLDELKKAHLEYQKRQDDKTKQETERAEIPSVESDKLPEAIICSGERDAMNVAGMGYYPLWMNSETAKLDKKTYNEIKKHVDKIYNIPDLDDTGIRKGNELALQYIDIYTIELPKWLTTFRDNRGRPRKDLRDFVELKPRIQDFKQLVRQAMPCRFWEKVYSKNSFRYEINTLYLLHFLKVNGFGKIVDHDNGNETYIKITDYKVKEIRTNNITDFVIRWSRENNLDHDIQNLILNSTRVSASTFEKVDEVNLDFVNNSVDSQLLFFNNKMVKVTAKGIEESRGGSNGVYAWEKSICKHDFKRIEPSFTATYIEDEDRYELKINHIKSHYFRFLINASRIYWNKEYGYWQQFTNESDKKKYIDENHWNIKSNMLSESEQQEQIQQLLNKIFVIGYLLHSYKAYSKAWGVWVMENKITDEDESSGGSGKTFMLRFLNQFKNMEMLNGRNKKLTDSDFFMDRITESTDMMLIDDADKYLNFNYFYSMLTDNMVVNYKNAKSKEISFKDSPKIVVTSNFPPPANDGSTARRILNCVFSDYYHKGTDDNEYDTSMRISDDFGYELHNESYKWDYWNEDYNFCVDCLQFYLSTIPHNSIIEPPMENVNQRMRLQTMGAEFIEWAEVFFSRDSENLDHLLIKQTVKDLFDPKKRYSMRGFTMRLRTFCRNCEYIEEFNPEEVRGFDTSNNRIVRKVEGTTTEFIYIKTIGTEINQELPYYQK